MALAKVIGVGHRSLEILEAHASAKIKSIGQLWKLWTLICQAWWATCKDKSLQKLFASDSAFSGWLSHAFHPWLHADFFCLRLLGLLGYNSCCVALRRILDWLFLGDLADATDLELLDSRGIGAVLNLIGPSPSWVENYWLTIWRLGLGGSGSTLRLVGVGSLTSRRHRSCVTFRATWRGVLGGWLRRQTVLRHCGDVMAILRAIPGEMPMWRPESLGELPGWAQQICLYGGLLASEGRLVPTWSAGTCTEPSWDCLIEQRFSFAAGPFGPEEESTGRFTRKSLKSQRKSWCSQCLGWSLGQNYQPKAPQRQIRPQFQGLVSPVSGISMPPAEFDHFGGGEWSCESTEIVAGVGCMFDTLE